MICVRRLPAWQDRFVAYKLLIDGTVAGSVREGASVKVAVDPGHHQVWMRIGWCRSRKLDVEVKDGGGVRLVCRGSAPPLLVLLYISVRRTSWIDLTSDT
jgi:hypothetical protein